MAASLPNIDERIAALRRSIQKLLESEQTSPEAEVDIAEQLSRQTDELESLAAERDALERAHQEELRKAETAKLR